MSAEVSFTKRAAAELSRCFNGISVSRQSSASNCASKPSSATSAGLPNRGGGSGGGSAATGPVAGSASQSNGKQQAHSSSNHSNGFPGASYSSSNRPSADIAQLSEIHLSSMNPQTPSKQRRPSRHGPPPKAPPKTTRARRKNYLLNLNKPSTLAELFANISFLKRFFSYVSAIDRCTLSQVCKMWCHILYDDSRYWKDLTFVIYYNQFRQSCLATEANKEAPSQTRPGVCSSANGSSGEHESISNANQGAVQLKNSGPIGANRMSPNANLNIDAQVDSTHRQAKCDTENGFSSLLYSAGSSTTGQFESANGNAFYARMLMMPPANGGNYSAQQLLVSAQPYPTLALLDKGDCRTRLYLSLKLRGFDSICLHGATDADIIEFTTQTALNDGLEKFVQVSIRHSAITDKGLEVFLASIARSLQSFELLGCNEISDSGLWSGLVPNLKSLTIQDCINVSDETIAAICQLLTSLKTLHIQAYHVTDSSMAYFSTSMLRETLRTLILSHCWEITNQGVVNLAHSLPNLTSLSLSGCSKVTDESIEIIAEQLRGLTLLDLSWCPRISDAALEYIACDLADSLQTLVLDRCLHITDIGLGYIATMARLENLSVRWCPQVRDFGIQALVSLHSLRTLSLAGCSHITLTGLSFLVRMQQLEELELTNCPTASKDMVKYLADNLPKTCTIIR